jgi:heme/copper-type cytochrome/quinol oxidase subunit 4
MFYFYTILLPLVILLLNYFVEGKPNTKRKIISYFFKSFLFLIIYTLLIYFLEMENYIDSGWAFYTLLFFLIPFAIIIIPIRLYYYIKKEK